MKTSCFLLLLAVAPLSAFAAAPFCAVTSAGAQCVYYDLGACRSALQGVGGQCVTNPAALPPPAAAPVIEPMQIRRAPLPTSNTSVLDGMAHVSQAGEIGAAQRVGPDAPAPRPKANDDRQPAGWYKVNYDCPNKDGSTYRSQFPVPGCVVVSLDFD